MTAKGCPHSAFSHTAEMPVHASATVGARFWLLIEHPGPWASHLEDCDLPEDVRTLVKRAAHLGIRPQLIRRPGRRTASPGPGVHVMVGDARGPEPWLAEAVIADPDDLDLDALVAGVLPKSCILVSEPVFLVCTHAKRNVCCARIGLPLARSLAEVWPDRTWETSHVGGDRYAANLVCLPHGLYYGSMSQAAAIAAADAYRSGEVVLDRFRGRAGIPEPLQAAEHFVRAHTGELSVGGVAVESSRSDGEATEAIVRGSDARFRVVVEPMTLTAPCGTACADTITTYRLVTLDRLTSVRYATPVPA
ncbi:sucrase ferredoxin [Planomonospora parontospora subsp. parontospora]|uniref:Sucrase ferredoxin n=2 Tax=Planomonospora parontospora TaxID=58119 RepID=A0AA37BKL2_9ACTN|nr:sucrase ferredoxin [Planomonospora parontospora]GGK85158.1 sucrase ferredoxin [Planomonospora parontospora]GII10668.1 sucrase ferredoxin [Planomonospora parontospora subsp. parontospora]